MGGEREGHGGGAGRRHTNHTVSAEVMGEGTVGRGVTGRGVMDGWGRGAGWMGSWDAVGTEQIDSICGRFVDEFCQ